MLASLFILLLVVVLIAGSTIVSMYIRSSAVSRYKKRLRRLPAVDVGEEPFYDNTKVAKSEMSQYARTAVAIVLLILVLLALVIAALMSAPFH